MAFVDWSGGQSTPAGKATEERRLSTPHPVATSTLVHPVRRKIPQEAFFASEEVEALPAESELPRAEINIALTAHNGSFVQL